MPEQPLQTIGEFTKAIRESRSGAEIQGIVTSISDRKELIILGCNTVLDINEEYIKRQMSGMPIDLSNLLLDNEIENLETAIKLAGGNRDRLGTQSPEEWKQELEDIETTVNQWGPEFFRRNIELAEMIGKEGKFTIGDADYLIEPSKEAVKKLQEGRKKWTN